MESAITVYTFNYFWIKFHFLNPRYKLRKTACKRLWDSCNCLGKKKNIIENLTKGIKVNAYQYLKQKLK